MDVTAQIDWNPKVKNGLGIIPDKTLYQMAKMTLDMSIPTIPKDSGTMRRTSMAGGVRGGNGDIYIGSYTDYATYVWRMTNVNWTTPGTNGQWYARTLKQHQATIVNNAINRAWNEVM